MSSQENTKFIDKYTKPSEVIPSEIADKKSQILTAKPELINIEDKESYKSFMELYEYSNWNIQRTKMIRNISLHGGTCLFLNQLNDEWQILQTNNVTRVIKDAAGNEEFITLYINLIKGNSGNYWLYQTHSKDKIYREVRREIPNTTPTEAFTNQPPYPWQSFLLETGKNLKQEIKTKEMTAFLIQLMNPEDEAIFSLPDSQIAKQQIQLLDLSYESLLYNLRAARVRIVIKRSTGANIKDAELAGDKFLVGGTIEIVDDTTYDAAAASISMAEPNPQIITESWKSYNKALVEVYTRTNLARPDDEDGAQKSQIEVAQIRDAEFSGMEKFISLIQSVYKKIMKSYFCIKNIKQEEYGWEIQRLEVQSELELLDNLEKMINLGFINKVDAIALARKVDKDAAKSIKKEIDKEKENNPITTNNTPLPEGNNLNQPNNEPGENVNA